MIYLNRYLGDSYMRNSSEQIGISYREVAMYTSNILCHYLVRPLTLVHVKPIQAYSSIKK